MLKAVELILDARVVFASHERAVDKETSDRFNFAADRIRLVRDQLADMGNARVLTVDVFERDQMTNRENLLERWQVQESAARAQQPVRINRVQDKGLSILLRSLYSFMRILPAHQLCRRRPGEVRETVIDYRFYDASKARPAMDFPVGVPCANYRFPTTEISSAGHLHLEVRYRKQPQLDVVAASAAPGGAPVAALLGAPNGASPGGIQIRDDHFTGAGGGTAGGGVGGRGHGRHGRQPAAGRRWSESPGEIALGRQRMNGPQGPQGHQIAQGGGRYDGSRGRRSPQDATMGRLRSTTLPVDIPLAAGGTPGSADAVRVRPGRHGRTRSGGSNRDLLNLPGPLPLDRRPSRSLEDRELYSGPKRGTPPQQPQPFPHSFDGGGATAGGGGGGGGGGGSSRGGGGGGGGAGFGGALAFGNAGAAPAGNGTPPLHPQRHPQQHSGTGSSRAVGTPHSDSDDGSGGGGGGRGSPADLSTLVLGGTAIDDRQQPQQLQQQQQQQQQHNIGQGALARSGGGGTSPGLDGKGTAEAGGPAASMGAKAGSVMRDRATQVMQQSPSPAATMTAVAALVSAKCARHSASETKAAAALVASRQSAAAPVSTPWINGIGDATPDDFDEVVTHMVGPFATVGLTKPVPQAVAPHAQAVPWLYPTSAGGVGVRPTIGKGAPAGGSGIGVDDDDGDASGGVYPAFAGPAGPGAHSSGPLVGLVGQAGPGQSGPPAFASPADAAELQALLIACQDAPPLQFFSHRAGSAQLVDIERELATHRAALST